MREARRKIEEWRAEVQELAAEDSREADEYTNGLLVGLQFALDAIDENE